MNPILQNVAAAVSAVGITAAGMAGIDMRYVDTAEASDSYQSKRMAEAHLASQLAVNTQVAATLIDLRIQQYRYIAEKSESPAERKHAEEQIEIAKAELISLSIAYSKHLDGLPAIRLTGRVFNGSG